MSRSGLKSVTQTERKDLLHRIYNYKALSIALTIGDHRNRGSEPFIEEVKQNMKKGDLPIAMELIEIFQNTTEQVRQQIRGKLGEMKDLEPLERKFAPQANIGTLLADLTGFYKAFGLEAGETIIDHLSVECEFMALLLLREAYAESSGNKEMHEIVKDAQKKFLRDHLGRSLYYFSKLKREDETLQKIASLGESFITSELGRFKMPGSRPGGFEKEDVEDNTECPFA